MLLSRLRPAKKKTTAPSEPRSKQPALPELDDFLMQKDYIGAVSVLEFKRKSGQKDEGTDLWLGHCYFRAGDFKKACDVYERMLKEETCPPEVFVFIGCCYFFLGMYQEAKDASDKSSKSPLQNRLLFHVSHKLGDERRLMLHHQQLGESLEDQLSLASIHYMRQHYQEAIEIYKSILTQHTNMIALNVYIGMCYYKMDFYDVASEMLAVYLRSFPDSPAALNLKACITYKTYTGKAAMPELEKIHKGTLYPAVKELLRHNSVVFRDGEGALQILPGMVDEVPEARLNLILYHLKREEISNALALCSELEPMRPTEFLIKAIVFAFWGIDKESKDHLRTAEQFFKMVGESTLECDTIPGRQSMACSFFLQQKFDEVVVYLNSIKNFHANDDIFNLNYGQALVMLNNFKEAEDAFFHVAGVEKERPLFKFMQARAMIMNRKGHFAWDLYSRSTDSKESFTLLRIIANDSFKISEFYWAAKAFDDLEKIDPSPEYWQGKLSSVAGLFKQLVQGKANSEQMSEVLSLLESGGQPQSAAAVDTIRSWAARNDVSLRMSYP